MNLKLQNLTKSFGSKIILDDVSIEIEEFKSLAIIGPSGGGKSTLLRILAGLETFQSGSVLVSNTELNVKDYRKLQEYRQHIGVVFQAYNLFPHLSALDNVILPLVHVHGIPENTAIEKANLLLDRFKLSDSKCKLPSQLSGGQQQRVAIVRALARESLFFLFDEPTSALDPELTAETLDVIHELQKENKEMIIVTHEMGFARSACDYVIFVSDGKIIEHNNSKELFANPKTKELSQFLNKILEWR